MKKLLAMLLAIITIMLVSPLNAFVAHADEEESTESVSHALVIKSDALSVKKKKTVQLTATVSNVETQPEIIWSSSDENIATVDSTGLVKGIQLGDVIIKAKATVGDQTIYGEFPLTVVKTGHLLKDYLADNQILSYQYSYVDDYYYTNDKEAWQYNFGFGKIYDFVSPYILLEYDYIRIFFTYEDKDWMIQMWKGQYGMVFFGGEIGVYNREHSEEGYGEWAMYACAPEEDWLAMEMTLYWQEEYNGEYVRQFTREYDKYWWCTGFVPGQLDKFSDRSELQIKCRITMKDYKMLLAFCGALKENGLVLGEDYTTSDLDVFVTW